MKHIRHWLCINLFHYIIGFVEYFLKKSGKLPVCRKWGLKNLFLFLFCLKCACVNILFQPEMISISATFHPAVPPSQITSFATQVCSGTVKPVTDFNPENDCKALHASMKGLGTDEATIIRIIPARSNAQRQQIRTLYKQMFGQVLFAMAKRPL